MNRNRKFALLAASLTFITVAIRVPAAAYADPILARYPGARTLDGEQFDLSRLRHGWVERQAAYHTGAEMTSVGLWYLALLEVGQDDEVHNALDCVSLRVVRLVLGIQRTVEVLLCPAVYGTRIAVHETLHLGP